MTGRHMTGRHIAEMERSIYMSAVTVSNDVTVSHVTV
jgi:hypothetical protein